MAIPSKFRRAGLGLAGLFALNLLLCSLLPGPVQADPPSAIFPPARPLPDRLYFPPARLNGLAALAAGLTPCATTLSGVSSTAANLPPGTPVDPETNPDSSASLAGDPLPRLEADLGQLIQAGLDNGLTSASVVIKDSASGQVIQLNPAQVYPSASLYKIYLLWKIQEEIEAGRLSDDSQIPLIVYTEDTPDPGDDTVPPPPPPPPTETISVSEARRLMITISDNSAAWSLAGVVGWYGVDAMLAAHDFGVTRLDSETPVTTAAEVTRFFEGLYRQDLDPGLTPADYALMLDLFKDQRINSKLSTGLPDGTSFAHKTGTLDDFNHDAGIIYTPDGQAIFITVLTQGNYEASQTLMEQVAEFSWQNLGQKPLAVFFPETGQTASGQILRYWQAQGGLASFGFPLNQARLELNRATGQYYLTQWFERARLEYHPENRGTAYEILLGLLGSELCEQALRSDPRFQATPAINNPANFIYFPQTGHNLGNSFLTYWQQNGGLARFGLPLSEEHLERNAATGQQYTVQWFERARFEWHPENAGTPYVILLGLLGKEYSGL
jgi:beta-lactamase class A